MKGVKKRKSSLDMGFSIIGMHAFLFFIFVSLYSILTERQSEMRIASIFLNENSSSSKKKSYGVPARFDVWLFFYLDWLETKSKSRRLLRGLVFA